MAQPVQIADKSIQYENGQYVVERVAKSTYYWSHVARRCKAHTTKSDYSIWYMNAENNCAEVALNKQRCLLRGYFFQIRGLWKSWGHRFFFSVNNIGVSIWNKQEIIGWLQYFTEICVQLQPPCKLSTLRSMGVGLLVYDKLITLQFRGCHTIFWLSIWGITIYCRGTFGNLWTPISKYGDLINSFIYGMCFLKI